MVRHVRFYVALPDHLDRAMSELEIAGLALLRVVPVSSYEAVAVFSDRTSEVGSDSLRPAMPVPAVPDAG